MKFSNIFHPSEPANTYIVIAYALALVIIMIFWFCIFNNKRWDRKHMDIPPLEIKDENFIIHNNDNPQIVAIKDVVDAKLLDMFKHDILLVEADNSGFLFLTLKIPQRR